MPVTERLMAAGSWSLNLKPETPKAIRDILDFWGHVFVFDAAVHIDGQSDASLIAMARWGGVVRARRPTEYDLAGASMIVWLGDEEGKGDIYETPIAGTNQTFSFNINNLINNASGAIHLGSVAAGGPTKSLSYQWVTPRAAIDHVCAVFGGEYRVNPDCTIDAGSATTLFATATTPDVIALRRTVGRDINAPIGLPVTALDTAIDAEEYITKALVQDSAGGWHGAAGSATPYNDLHGNVIIIKKAFVSSLTPAAQGAGLAATLVASAQTLRQEISLSTDEYDIERDVNVGDYIWVYDPDANLVDMTNQVWYGGGWVFPTKVRVLASTWPIEMGMTVGYRDLNGVWTDLTEYVNFENPGVTFEVGAKRRALLTFPT
jgi:hypothetical protein